MVAIVVCLLTGSAVAQRVPTLSRDAYASVLTILPGTPMYSAFGHTAIRIRDDSLGIDVVYNFGTFDFDTDWFYLKFARGLLDYRLARNHFEDVLAAYTEERRPIIEQRLALDGDERRVMVLRLEENYLPENRFYRYDFFFDNCSTRPRDVIDTVVGSHILGTDSTGNASFRELIDPYIAPRPWTHLGIDMLLGSKTDRLATSRERMFLPDELMSAIGSATLRGEPLVSETDTLFWPRGYDRPTSVPILGPGLLLVVLLVLGVAVIFSPLREKPAVRYFDAGLFLVAGLAGFVMIFLWFGTQHTVTRDNWNLLWALPTHVLAAVALFRNYVTNLTRTYFGATAVLCALLLAGWFLIGQEFHWAIGPLVGLLLVRAAYRARTPPPPISIEF